MCLAGRNAEKEGYECPFCKKQFPLWEDLEGFVRGVGNCCKACEKAAKEKAEAERTAKKIANAIPGLIEVKFAGSGNAYAYHCEYDVKVGDVVIVPSNWFRDEGEALVVSVHSDYEGSVSSILSVVSTSKNRNN